MAGGAESPASSGRGPNGLAVVGARELRAMLRTNLLWLVPMMGFVVLMAALQPSMSGDGGLLAAKLRAMPPVVLKFIGIALQDFHRPAGYAATTFIYVVLVGSLHAAAFGASVVAREEALRTAELLFAQPVSRRALLAGKTAAALAFVLSFHLLLAAGMIGTFAISTDAPLEADLLASLFVGSAALAVCFLGAGMLVASLVRDARRANGAALGVVLGAYLLSALSAVARKAELLGWLSPFKLFSPSRIVEEGGLAPWHTALLVVLGVVFGAAAAIRFEHRDIRA